MRRKSHLKAAFACLMLASALTLATPSHAAGVAADPFGRQASFSQMIDDFLAFFGVGGERSVALDPDG